MTGALQVLNSVEPRLLQHAGDSGSPSAVAGWLVGLVVEGRVLVTSNLRSKVNFDKSLQLQQDIEEVSSLLPGDLRIVGTYALWKDRPDHGKMTTQIQATDLCICSYASLQAYQERSGLGKNQLLCAILTADSVSWFQLHNATSAKPVEAQVLANGDIGNTAAHSSLLELDSKYLEATFTKLYFESTVKLHVYGVRPSAPAEAHIDSGPSQPFKAAIADAIHTAADDLCSSSTVLLAKAPSGEPMLLTPESSQAKQVCGDFRGRHTQAVDITLLSKGSLPQAAAQPPCIIYQPVAGGSCSYDTTTITLSVLCYVPNKAPLADLQASYLQPAIRRQLSMLQHKIVQQGNLQPWTVFQVQPPGWPHCLTLMYPLANPKAAKGRGSAQQGTLASKAEEEDLRPVRQALHDRFGLPANRPLLRLSNAIDPRAAVGLPQSLPGARAARLQDVHVGINPPPVAGGTVHMIEGSYDYHHYMQDKTDDAGWGCAYRSLQTIHSWFRHQHYTQQAVPPLRDIQQTLVDIGDKPQSFVGSREWIGAIELGYVLDERLGVIAKVITVASGAEMGTKSREIAQHFDSQGTPIMIGGGVLAYTLLGISHNERTGECAFLILDPHYTDDEDLFKIQNGQWVAWKSPLGKAAAGGSLFVQNAFYNLLCPQRPNMI
ncbi:TPA: hypothetical protein ACH3X2_008184 [Trebouxia sp. C0005]|nr:MAG: putative Ufm1-specific protease-like [Trebouxia sp. A1-2]